LITVEIQQIFKGGLQEVLKWVSEVLSALA
jgi:hypothetical protein